MNGTNPLLTLSMIVKNEQRYLSECLQSVCAVADEIIIVDTGSTDKTIDIANSFGADVYHFDWNDDFSAARNFALSKSAGRWILYLDADERLTPESIPALMSIKKSEEKCGYRCTVNSINEFGGKSNTMLYTRLFYNSQSIRFNGKVHEQIDDSLASSGYKLLFSEIQIIHLGYNLTTDELKNKAVRNLNMLLSEYEQSKSSYYAYQLANTFQVLEDEKSALDYYQAALKDKNLPGEYRCVALLNLADAEVKKHNLKKASLLIKEAIIADENNPMIYMLASAVSIRANQFSEALSFAKKALEVNEGTGKSILNVRMDKEKIIYQALLAALFASDNKSFRSFLNEIKGDSSVYELLNSLYNGEYIDRNKYKPYINEDNITLILNLINKHPDNNYSLELLQNIQYKFSDNAQYLNALGQALAENNMYNEAALVLEKSLMLKQKDPSAVFHLVSVYLMSNKTERVSEIINYAEKEFNNMPDFIARLIILKEKVKPILLTHQVKGF